ncbi:MAG: LCP family protein [Oscillospiraceae bacterium]|jgi:LCP family protein required for cell wall assembly|nr:LCP family protein [Oscillospiraceae bacterium]
MNKLERTLLGVVLLAAVIIMGGFGYLWAMNSHPFEDNEPMPLTNELLKDNPIVADEGNTFGRDKYMNVLFLGLDESETLTDVMMLASVNLTQKKLNILQIPRDTYISGLGNTGKINEVYLNGGTNKCSVQNVVNYINRTLQMSVNHYAMISTEDVVSIVDAVGGIPIDVPERIFYEADKIIEPGQQILEGRQAEWFVRFRREYAEADLGRIKTQRIFLAACMQKAKSLGLSEIIKVTPTVLNYVKTDMSVGQLKDLAMAFMDIKMEDCNCFMLPGEPTMYNKLSVYSMHKEAVAQLLNLHFRWNDEIVSSSDLEILELVNKYTDYNEVTDDFASILAGNVPKVPRN